jgi:hypothetical protein
MTSGDMTASLRTGAAPPISLATLADAAVARICAAIAGDRPRYEHEVLPASRERLAVSGWFLRRA